MRLQSSSEKDKRIMVSEPHSAPYRDGTFVEMRKNTNMEWMILTGNKSHRHSEWNYISPNEEIRRYSNKTLEFRITTYQRGFLKMVLKFKPDIVITNSVIEAVVAKSIRHSHIVLYADTIKQGKHGNSYWNRMILTWLYKTANAIWVPGRAGKQYFESYLKGSRPVYCGTYTEDANQKIQKINDLRRNRSDLRGKLGIDDTDFLFLFIGKLIPTRHVGVLLKCMKRMANGRIKTLIIGDGPDEEIVHDYLLSEDNVKWIPHVSLEELETYYAIADAYIHPGEEPYSLALYEAAIAGIPILASKQVGATSDCLCDGKNGYLLKYCNPSDMHEKMLSVANGDLSENDIKKMQKFILDKRGIAWSSKQLMRACNFN